MLERVIYILAYITIFLFGIVIGSFLNVCIFRMPKKENISEGSHCMSCGYRLSWYDLVPLFSYLMLKGRCRKCGAKLSKQYPLVEGLNGLLYVIVILANGFNIMSVIYCLFTSALIVLSFIDYREQIIPNKVCLFILMLGIFATLYDYKNYKEHLIGGLCISLILLIIFLVTVGRAMGGGDVKLMAVCGLLVGWKYVTLGFVLGCILASIVHLIIMAASKDKKSKLAFGPYLSAGVWFSFMFGEPVITWYLRIIGLA